MSEPACRRIEPLPEPTQALLRRLIAEAGNSAEELARRLQLPASSLVSAAAGVRMHATTRRRIQHALERQGQPPRPGHLRAVPRIGQEGAR